MSLDAIEFIRRFLFHVLPRTADAPRIAPATLIAIRIRAHSAASALRQQLSIPILLPR
jgi:hypothetical protein